MLYVVVTADRPRVIVIDEPQSFLHPGAVRKLFEILARYSQHQYVVATHAPNGLNVAGASNMLLVRRGADQSVVTRLDPTTNGGVSIFLSEVGARLGDVFGADNVLWVEGKTEERCFPFLIRDIANQMLGGTQILGVVNTGDLEAKFAERIVTIYQRLSSGQSVLPPAVAFVFDREGRSERQREDLSRRGKGLVQWLPRRMFENYLLQPAAICELINAEDASRETPASIKDVEEWLSANGEHQQYFQDAGTPPEFGSPLWEETVHAGKILNDIVGSLTQQRVRYDKVNHGERLTRILVRDPSAALVSLSQFLATFCK